MTTVSIILPTYNAAQHLRETLDSILNQTLQADQIVIINDGSTDQSLEIISTYQRKEQRIQIIDQPNGGVSRARNRGLGACHGDFIALMDSDDICLPTRLEEQVKALNKRNADICGSWMRNFGEKQRISKYPKQSSAIKWNYLFFGRTIANPTSMIRHSIVGTTRYNESLAFAEDYGFFLELLIKNPEIQLINIQKPLIRYRTHPGQATQRLSSQNLNNLTIIQKRLIPAPHELSLDQMVPLHVKLWRSRQPLSKDELISYLPFMAFLTNWLSKDANAPELAATYWLRLIKLHRSSDYHALDLIQKSSAPFVASWRTTIERVLISIF